MSGSSRYSSSSASSPRSARRRSRPSRPATAGGVGSSRSQGSPTLSAASGGSTSASRSPPEPLRRTLFSDEPEHAVSTGQLRSYPVQAVDLARPIKVTWCGPTRRRSPPPGRSPAPTRLGPWRLGDATGTRGGPGRHPRQDFALAVFNAVGASAQPDGPGRRSRSPGRRRCWARSPPSRPMASASHAWPHCSGTGQLLPWVASSSRACSRFSLVKDCWR
jgi:hypothetical protein